LGDRELTRQVKEVASETGADLVGVVGIGDLSEHEERLARILPGARSVVVVASRHGLAAIASDNIQVAQFDTIHAYDQCARAAHRTSRFLESRGFPAVAIPAFIPIDMEAPGKGMRGEICWRRTGVRAGLGSYGENGLLVTREFGAAVRLSGLVTSADLEADSPLDEDVCDHCRRCVEACPVGALSGDGKIDKKLCGDEIFRYGFRHFQQLLRDLSQRDRGDLEEILGGYGLRETWQTFMTGNYYYCFQCQSRCPASELPTAASSLQ
jgi:epoxyqueuosine reductase QueG